jgi:hypothetical protein
MNFIQTLYYDDFKCPYNDHFGWLNSKYHLISWALSCLQIKALYGSVDLYCNNSASSFLIDDLQLPYNKVFCTHNDIDIPHKQLWALPKIYTYALQKEPFLHIDGDVFLFDKLPEKLLQGSLIAQNVEEATSYYLQTQKELMANFTHFPNCVAEDFNSGIPIKAVNAGIFGGNNIDFFKEYTDLAFEYVNQNIKYLDLVNADRFNVFFEQHLFYSLAKEKKLDIEVLIDTTFKDNQYLYLGNFHETPCKRSYLHLLGQYKKDIYTCGQMAAKLRELYPEYYYRILLLLKKHNLKIFSFTYNDDTISSFNSYETFVENAKRSFTNGIEQKDITDIEQHGTRLETIEFLSSHLESLLVSDFYTPEEVKSDFQTFEHKLRLSAQKRINISNDYIYGRDLASINWYCKIFADETNLMDKYIEKFNEIDIFETSFDWSGFYNKLTRTAVPYYEELFIQPGNFYHLVIPEVYDDGFSLHDLDEMENIILSHLISPLKIDSLFKLMLQYVDDDIVENHLDEYQKLFFEMLKQLVLKKAIKPYQTK